MLPEGPVVLHKDHGGPVLEDQLLQLDAGEQVDIVQRLVPDIQPSSCEQAARERSLFALAKSLESEGQMRDARAAYELIVKNKLPSWQTAERKLKNTQI